MEAPSSIPLIEIGWLVAGELEPLDRNAVEGARDQLLAYLSSALPQFVWRMPLLRRRRLVELPRVEPVPLLEAAAVEREAHAWDFVLVITDAELMSRYTSFALGMPARSLSAAVLSTAHLEPAPVPGATEEAAARTLRCRIERLAMHLLGHLNGLQHCEDPRSAMWQIRVARDLDGIGGFLGEELEELAGELQDVADLRLEEEPGPRPHPVRFYLRSAWHNRGDILANVRQIAPWRFPLRFGRLTIAAVSTLLILMITAESWDLGMSQRLGVTSAFAAASVIGASIFVLQRQRLLVRRPARLTEQTVVTNLSMALSVAVGLLTTWLLLFALVFAFGLLLFPDELVRGWATSLEQEPGIDRYLVFSGFVATLGILIGALGASFEPGGYFRHVAWIDEET